MEIKRREETGFAGKFNSCQSRLMPPMRLLRNWGSWSHVSSGSTAVPFQTPQPFAKWVQWTPCSGFGEHQGKGAHWDNRSETSQLLSCPITLFTKGCSEGVSDIILGGWEGGVRGVNCKEHKSASFSREGKCSPSQRTQQMLWKQSKETRANKDASSAFVFPSAPAGHVAFQQNDLSLQECSKASLSVIADTRKIKKMNVKGAN